MPVELIYDCPEPAFELAMLPKGIETALKRQSFISRTEQEYHLYSEFRRTLKHSGINDEGTELGLNWETAFSIYLLQSS